jgi:hypothetical protein
MSTAAITANDIIDRYADAIAYVAEQAPAADLDAFIDQLDTTARYHVALYTGDDTIIEAPRTGDVVKTASLWIMGTPDFYARP